ncbi:MAG: MarR family transcriptional regulator [Acidobacteriia bacterium]|nr:MarR family transcriptional regulator [Terriglobia bacterium]
MAKAAEVTAWSAELERLARVLNRVGPDEVCCESLTPRQCGILRTLADKQGARLSDLAAETGITPSAMTRVLDKLEAQGLIQRVRGAGEDGRAAMVAITERGRAIRGRIDQLMLDRTRAILKGIPAGFRPQLLAGIRMLNQALGPGGCCDFSGEWPDVGVSCRVTPNDQPAQRRKSHARQGN